MILFGSRARGEGDSESDVDVLVVLDDGNWRFHDDVALESFEPSLQNSVLISPVTMDRDDYEWHKQHRAPFYRLLERDGLDLWTTTPAPLYWTFDKAYLTQTAVGA